jgi:hypothetical protein
MPRNILIFSDGTGQAGGLTPDERISNVYKLYRAARVGPESSVDPAEQLAYDRSGKRYLATKDFQPVFRQPDADRYLNQLRSIGNQVLRPEEAWIAVLPEFEAMPLPRRRVDPALATR